MMIKKISRSLLALLIAGAVSAAASAEQSGQPTSLDADTLTYDTRTGVVTAETNVVMVQGSARVAGQRATYNTKTEEGTIEGGVVATREDMRLTCDRLFAESRQHWQASGNVNMSQAGRTFTGAKADYFPEQNGYILAEAGGTITSPDGTLSADRLEGWLKEEHYIGTGNAHILSPPRDMEGGGDRMDYFGGEPRRRVVLTGHAWVLQGNNMARGNRMTVYLADDGTPVAE